MNTQMENKAPNRLMSMATMKCPNCHKGSMYKNKSILPLNEFMVMPEHCEVCGLKFEIETGFWFGTGYVSYALSVGTIFVLAVIFALTYGFTWRNNSIFIFIGVMISALVLLQPWIMRFSRVLYIYVFVKYKSSAFK
jgi:uncharacterized protein (DUF983 family)